MSIGKFSENPICFASLEEAKAKHPRIFQQGRDLYEKDIVQTQVGYEVKGPLSVQEAERVAMSLGIAASL